MDEEKQLGKALRGNQQQWQAKVTKTEEKYSELKTDKDKEVAELKEQLRDLMFFIEAKQVYIYFSTKILYCFINLF